MIAEDKAFLERLAKIQRETEGEGDESTAHRFLEEFGNHKTDNEPGYVNNMRNHYKMILGIKSDNIDYSFKYRLENRK